MGDSHRHAARGRKGQHRWLRFVAAGACVALIAAACGGGGGGGSSSSGNGSSSSGNGDTGAKFGKPDNEGTPQRGGEDHLRPRGRDRWWLVPAGRAARSRWDRGRGLDLRHADRARRAADGSVEYVPFLAESVEPNAAYDQWTIKVRPDITFHNGEPLNAAAVKQNLDAYRGQAPSSGPLFSFVFEQINDVVVVDDSTVQVNMDGPWVGFDAFIWGTGRVGMVAPAQLERRQHLQPQPHRHRAVPHDELQLQRAVRLDDQRQAGRRGQPRLLADRRRRREAAVRRRDRVPSGHRRPSSD